MQNVGTVIRRPISIGTAAASGLLAFLAGLVIALAAPALVAGLSVNHNSSVTSSVSTVGAEQVAHNRAEEGLVSYPSIGGEQIAHNRSEQGLGG